METKSILVVDDEKNIRLTMCQSLEPLGMPIETAINGEEALTMFEQGRFGMVFLDLKMPSMDSMDVLRWIKENQGYHYNGPRDYRHRNRGYEAGCYGFHPEAFYAG